jgi:microcystin-dependent protein
MGDKGQWGQELRTGRESLRQSQQSDMRPRSVNERVLRSDDSLFEYDDDDLTPVGGRGIIADVTGNADTATVAGPAGALMAFAGTSAPTGYLECDGSAVSRTTYSTLFDAIGTTWGSGDGSTTFNVPDLRGAFARGTGSHGSETMADGNPFAGPAVGSFEDDQMQGHEHFVGHADDTDGDFSGYDKANSTGGEDRNTAGIVTDTTNGTPRTGDETRPFAAGILWCIKT